MIEQPGFPRGYFHARLARAMRQAAERKDTVVIIVDITEAMNTLMKCPVCGGVS